MIYIEYNSRISSLKYAEIKLQAAAGQNHVEGLDKPQGEIQNFCSTVISDSWTYQFFAQHDKYSNCPILKQSLQLGTG